jgi:hypothetical protein
VPRASRLGGSAVVTSTDSISWVGHPLTISQTLRAVAVDATGGIAVAVGDGGHHPNQRRRRQLDLAQLGHLGNLRGVARGAGVVVAVGVGGLILTSPDGITWTTRASGTSVELLAITFGTGQFVATGYAGTILISADGVGWTSQASGTTQYLSGVAYDPEGFVAVGSAGTVLTSSTSSGAVTWTGRTPLTTQALVGVTARSGTYAAADGGKNTYTSTDGVTWTSQPLGPPSLRYGWADTNAGIVTLRWRAPRFGPEGEHPAVERRRQLDAGAGADRRWTRHLPARRRGLRQLDLCGGGRVRLGLHLDRRRRLDLARASRTARDPRPHAADGGAAPPWGYPS